MDDNLQSQAWPGSAPPPLPLLLTPGKLCKYDDEIDTTYRVRPGQGVPLLLCLCSELLDSWVSMMVSWMTTYRVRPGQGICYLHCLLCCRLLNIKLGLRMRFMSTYQVCASQGVDHLLLCRPLGDSLQKQVWGSTVC